MDINQYIPFLETFRLVIVNLFFCLLILICVYSVYALYKVKKHVTNVLTNINQLIDISKNETYQVAHVLKEKAETINLSNTALIGSIIGTIFTQQRNASMTGVTTVSIAKKLLKLFK
jgi:hypothetical protein